MKLWEDFPFPLSAILKDMCEFAGLDPREVDLSHPEKYAWTERQKEKFSQYMYKRLSKRGDIYRKAFTSPPYTKRGIKNLVEEFISNYGFKVTYR